MEDKISVDITDPIITENIEEEAYEISQIYSQIKIDNLEHKHKILVVMITLMIVIALSIVMRVMRSLNIMNHSLANI